jgi:hypothetical protein
MSIYTWEIHILNHKSVKSKIPPYLKDHYVPIISHTSTTLIAIKIFTYKKVLQDLNIADLRSTP